MAIIIQVMVPALISGVLFAADPVSGSPTRMSGAFVEGLGHRLVSGEAIPDVMTPFTASAMENGPMAKSMSFNGISAYGVICGRPYLNISVFASILSAMGKGNDHFATYAGALKRKLTTIVGHDDAEALLSGISREDRWLACMGPLIGLSQLADNRITTQQYLDRYGDRSACELELSAPRPAEIPGWLEKQVFAFRMNVPNVESQLRAQRKRSQSAWHRLKQTAPGKVRLLKNKTNLAAERAHLREQVRAEYVRIFGVWRQWARQAGRITGVQQEIFFLRFEEVLDLLEGHQDQAS